jgi:hypothetical protein
MFHYVPDQHEDSFPLLASIYPSENFVRLTKTIHTSTTMMTQSRELMGPRNRSMEDVKNLYMREQSGG